MNVRGQVSPCLVKTQISNELHCTQWSYRLLTQFIINQVLHENIYDAMMKIVTFNEQKTRRTHFHSGLENTRASAVTFVFKEPETKL